MRYEINDQKVMVTLRAHKSKPRACWLASIDQSLICDERFRYLDADIDSRSRSGSGDMTWLLSPGIYAYKEVSPSCNRSEHTGFLCFDGDELLEITHQQAVPKIVEPEGLPRLHGSSKQVEWASQIRAQLLAKIERYDGPDADILEYIKDDILACNSAILLINRRNASPESLIADAKRQRQHEREIANGLRIAPEELGEPTIVSYDGLFLEPGSILAKIVVVDKDQTKPPVRIDDLFVVVKHIDGSLHTRNCYRPLTEPERDRYMAAQVII